MTGKKDHPQADELQALLDGEWSGREAQEMAGHLEGCDILDVLSDGTDATEWRSPRILIEETHGTGCTFSAATAAGLAEILAWKVAGWQWLKLSSPGRMPSSARSRLATLVAGRMLLVGS